MTWMIIRLILSLGLIAVVLVYAARLAKKRGLGQGSGLIEVVSSQRLGRTSSVNVVRIADVVLVVGATEEQITLLAEMDAETIDGALRERTPVRLTAARDMDADDSPTLVARSSAPSGALAGSVLDRDSWGGLVHQLRERTVRRS
ncbi:FliO/MopB family protein [Blastococcus goldschmidtiae]|uniref:Flagellar biosynthetic protein FliO n=1 Tax=Blastococcus goldschmidtiae TaxID=3075546 RepID=A0ABU2K637_9ACTN|nr:flagellar biosynthetic protein FliO [Blastococcus sp. DSM 46792]MDT0275659.1 flagellar biosynthetic protein FliO [Blastococcus sp. DSM 46792]